MADWLMLEDAAARGGGAGGLLPLGDTARADPTPSPAAAASSAAAALTWAGVGPSRMCIAWVGPGMACRMRNSCATISEKSGLRAEVGR